MDIDPLQWLPDSFTRVPHWRWLRAQCLVAKGASPNPQIDDDWVLHARNAVAGRTAGRAAAAIEAALAVRDGPLERRWELEARLLTDESLEHVALKCALPVETVGAFAHVFFAVRERQKAKDWLMLRAVGYSPLSGFKSPQPGGLWKYAAVTGGTAALDLVIAVTTDRPLPAGAVADTRDQREVAESLLRERVKVWVALILARSDAEVAAAVEARQQLRKLEAEASDCASDTPPVLLAMEEFLRALPGTRSEATRAGGRAHRKAVGRRRQSRTPRKVTTDQVAGSTLANTARRPEERPPASSSGAPAPDHAGPEGTQKMRVQ
jgi:hypothetical protein